MASCPGSASGSSIFSNLLQFWKEWQITILLLVTMWLQLLLVLAGFARKRTSNSLLHSVVWFSFIGIDAVAAYAIGLMLGAGCDTVFAIWAPIVLYHLGAADSISAYSAADNDLWQRHGLKMTLEMLGTTYIVSRASQCRRYFAVGVLLFIVGGFKYGERIHALWSGSANQVLRSGRALYKFMALDDQEDATQASQPLIVSGEADWYSIHNKNPHHKLRDSKSVVTFNDIATCQDLKKIAKNISDLCLAHALFKMYRRRLTNLRIHHKDDDYEKVRKIFFPAGQQVSPLKIIRVIDFELSFIYDGVFTKGAAGRAYQGIGVATRFISLLLLFVISMDLIAIDALHISCESSSVHLPGAITHLLVTIALFLEGLQLWRIIRSNWTRVWLACSFITEQRLVQLTTHHHYLNSFHQFNVRAIITAFRYVGAPKMGNWHQSIGQRSIVVDSMNSVCWHYLKLFEIKRILMVREKQAAILNLVDVDVSNLQYFLVEKMAQKFADVTSRNLASRREQIARSMRFPFEGSGPRIGPEFSPAQDSGLEEAVLNWHLATSICEMDLLQTDDLNRRHEDVVKMSIGLSRYCMHLLISCPKLTPGDPDVWVPLYTRLKEHMMRIFLQHPRAMESALLKDYIPPPPEDAEALRTRARRESIDPGVLLGRTLMQWTWEQRWNKLSEVWVDILIYIAIAENAHPHTEQMAKGGELLTHFWVLLGHLGFGQKSWITRPDG